MDAYAFTEPRLWTFLLQAIVFSIVFPAAFIAYSFTRGPQRTEIIKKDLRLLGLHNTHDLQTILDQKFILKDYIWPVFSAFFVSFVIYSLTHPYTIQRGIWAGVLEEFVDIFGMNGAVARDLAAGRFLFWAWVGAWVYSVNLLLRRFMAYDLSPIVYVFIIARFLLAWLVASVVGMALGTISTNSGMASSINLTTVFVVVFFIGFFPERGISWITSMAKRALGEAGGVSNEQALSSLEGMSIWQQSRLNQEGIENVQNMANANIPLLVMTTPFTIGQIIDWIDQAILLVYADANNKRRNTERENMYSPLESTGIRCASDFLAVCGDPELFETLVSASGVDSNRLKMLFYAVQSANNIQTVCNYRWQFSVSNDRRLAAFNLRPFLDMDKHKTEEMRAILAKYEAAVPATDSGNQ